MVTKFRRIAAKMELYGICLLWPIAAVGVVVGSYKLFMWSYGGKECFRFIVIQEPFKEQWYQANPKAVLGRETPLANVPKFLETPGHDDGNVQHNHHNNY
ncbi:transmembrane protein, putative [Bodo saltans]|uniref:Transmembrane protein, putative n=1 Tax=Bodo saltans TaxID=75058 RepID=A0A0S4J1K9_BODSA|nr:transmembrane protein, putative [Bodo saltans]|eukprot:CUG04221.1 transmembrane protein, putative [Bodo saltans]